MHALSPTHTHTYIYIYIYIYIHTAQYYREGGRETTEN